MNVSVAPPIETDIAPQFALFGLTTALGRKQSAIADRRALLIKTHPSDVLPAAGMISSAYNLRSDRDILGDTPQQVLATLRQQQKTLRNRYNCALAAYELHHFTEPEIGEVLELLSQSSPQAVLGADYTFLGATSQEVQAATNTNAELFWQTQYGGFAPWMADHARFTPEQFIAITSAAARWKSYQAIQLPRLTTGFIASLELEQSDLRAIVAGAGL